MFHLGALGSLLHVAPDQSGQKNTPVSLSLDESGGRDNEYHWWSVSGWKNDLGRFLQNELQSQVSTNHIFRQSYVHSLHPQMKMPPVPVWYNSFQNDPGNRILGIFSPIFPSPTTPTLCESVCAKANIQAQEELQNVQPLMKIKTTNPSGSDAPPHSCGLQRARWRIYTGTLRSNVCAPSYSWWAPCRPILQAPAHSSIRGFE